MSQEIKIEQKEQVLRNKLREVKFYECLGIQNKDKETLLYSEAMVRVE
jgi:hypothetical protein